MFLSNSSIIARSDHEFLKNVVMKNDAALTQVFGTVYTVDDPDLIEALIGAKRRGLDVRICALQIEKI